MSQKSVFYAAAVGFCFWMGDGFACEGGVEGFANVVSCFGAIGRAGRWDTIDSAGINDLAFGVDNKYVGGCFGAVFLTDIP